MDDGVTAGTLDHEPEGSQTDLPREPEQPLRYKVQFTAGQEYVDLVNEAGDLLSHEMPRPDLPEVQLRAMRELVKQLKKRKRAATEPTPNPDAPNTAPASPARQYGAESAVIAPARHIPAAVRRAVWARDGERCAYVDCRGHRCRESRGLELHHRRAHALGGPPTFDNLEVRCKAHNTLAAEGDFGREHVDRARGVLHARS
jgi:hypothetical protein